MEQHPKFLEETLEVRRRTAYKWGSGYWGASMQHLHVVKVFERARSLGVLVPPCLPLDPEKARVVIERW